MKTDGTHPKTFQLFPRSIKRRLPATYALIALLVAVSLGGVLVGILSEYYRQQEIDYLRRNATAVLPNLTHMIEADATEDALQEQLNLFAFLSRTQMDILDLNDTLDLSSDTVVSVIDIDNAQSGLRLEFRQFNNDEVWIATTETSPEDILAVTDVIVEDGVKVETIIEEQQSSGNFTFDVALPGSTTEEISHAITTTTDNRIFVNRGVGLYGFALGQTDADMSDVTHSTQVITADMIDSTGTKRGILRLSQGPAFGVEIVTSVAWGWLLASLFSITLAVIVGYLMSRDVTKPLQALTETTKQMATGDLSARAMLQRYDEFGILAASFNDMANQIETTVSTLHHFVSDAAHEINTPITALRTNLELIQPESSDQLVLNRALAQVQRLEDLTRNLLHLSRLESDMQPHDLVQHDIIPVIRETVSFFASRADQCNIGLDLSFSSEAIPYVIDSHHLQTALSNVIDNALKFTPSGGQVWVAVEESQDEISIHVRDTGVGIPRDHVPYVFNRFHRASNVSDYAGSGLGLSIVHTVIEHYSGRVTIKNLEQGTQVSLYLPIGL